VLSEKKVKKKKRCFALEQIFSLVYIKELLCILSLTVLAVMDRGFWFRFVGEECLQRGIGRGVDRLLNT